jgi:hypothetical protein
MHYYIKLKNNISVDSIRESEELDILENEIEVGSAINEFLSMILETNKIFITKKEHATNTDAYMALPKFLFDKAIDLNSAHVITEISNLVTNTLINTKLLEMLYKYSSLSVDVINDKKIDINEFNTCKNIAEQTFPLIQQMIDLKDELKTSNAENSIDNILKTLQSLKGSL